MNYSFDIEVAKIHGVDAAILIENFRFWIAKNKANDKHFYKNRYWTYNSVKAFTELFPFWTARQLERIIKNLEESGILISDNFNESKYNRTKWYTLNEKSILPNSKLHLTECVNEINETVKTLIYTDINTDVNTDTDTAAKAVKKNNFNVVNFLQLQNVEDKTIDEWLQVRKAKKSVNTESAIEAVINNIEKAGLTIDAGLKICVQESWAGFKGEWLINKQSQFKGKKQVQSDEELIAMRDRVLRSLESDNDLPPFYNNAIGHNGE